MASKEDETEIAQVRREINELHAKLKEKESYLEELQDRQSNTLKPLECTKLSNEDIERYSRQLILPGFGVSGQLKLKSSSFLIVGVGGLGCPAAQYLLAAGCGRIGLVDYDNVERSNFHRQTLHTEERIGYTKVNSARIALQKINPNCDIVCYNEMLDSNGALQLISQYDVILDCSDNVVTRYLLNDTCVMQNKPLVSGSALQMDGQLTVYNYGEQGPCYRCIFPVPPPRETVTNCGDGGVLGAVTGVIGALQALEAIKVAIGMGDVLSRRLLIFDGTRCVFRNIKLRAKRPNCDICSAQPLITGLINYELFCGMRASDKDYGLFLLDLEKRINVKDYKEIQKNTKPHLLLDVRQPAEYEICQLPNSINMPLKQILDDTYLTKLAKELEDDNIPIYVLCRRGNDSQIAVEHMQNRFPKRRIQDIIGGLHEWHYKIDNNFPIY